MKPNQEMLDKINENAIGKNPFTESMKKVKGEKDKKNTTDMPPRPSSGIPESSDFTKEQSSKTMSELLSKNVNIGDIVDSTERAKKKGGRSRTFYFKDSMYDNLVEVAKKYDTNPSQLLHSILDTVLPKM